MRSQTNYPTYRHLVIVATTTALLGLGQIGAPARAAESFEQFGSEAPLILAATDGRERRDDRRDDRQDDRGDRGDTRQDCRDEEGVGKDKRDCKQEDRQDRRKGDDD